MKLPGNMQAMMKQAQQMQEKMAQEIAQIRVEASSGGGMVKVTADGRGTVRAVSIDPAVFQDHDADFLSDLVLTAVAEAQRRAAEMLQAEMRKVPPLPFTSPF